MSPEAVFISFAEPENIAGIKLLEKLGYKYLGYIPSEGAQAFGRWAKRETEEKFSGPGR